MPASCSLSPNALLLLYRGRNAWINPFTQKKLATLAIKRETSNMPISSLDSPILVNTIEIIKKVRNLKILITCNPVTLFTFLVEPNTSSDLLFFVVKNTS